MEITDSLTIKSRAYFSLQHLHAAVLFAVGSRDIEKEYDGVYTEAIYFKDKSYCVGAIISSVLFLEATINEFFIDAVELPDLSEIVKDIDPQIKKLLAVLWQYGSVDYLKPLEKYERVFAVMEKPEFEKGNSYYQNVSHLIKLRNALVHYKPEWIGDSPHKFENYFKGKFALNPMIGSANPYYPDRCFGYGFAKWSIDACVKFVDEFFNRIDLVYPFKYFHDMYCSEY
jgi:hypothetical protein